MIGINLLHPCSFKINVITICYTFFYLSKLLFSGFCRYKANFVWGPTNSKYHDWSPSKSKGKLHSSIKTCTQGRRTYCTNALHKHTCTICVAQKNKQTSFSFSSNCAVFNSSSKTALGSWPDVVTISLRVRHLLCTSNTANDTNMYLLTEALGVPWHQ